MFQSTIHGFKVLAKEDTVPDQADRGTFTLAPWMVYMAAAMSMLVIPFAPGAVAANFNIGIVYFFAVLGLSVVGIILAGWASNNKWSLFTGGHGRGLPRWSATRSRWGSRSSPWPCWQRAR